MSHLRQVCLQVAADALSRRIGRDQLRVLGLQPFQFFEEPVVFAIGDDRRAEHMVTVVVLVESAPQSLGAGFEFAVAHRCLPHLLFRDDFQVVARCPPRTLRVVRVFQLPPLKAVRGLRPAHNDKDRFFRSQKQRRA